MRIFLRPSHIQFARPASRRFVRRAPALACLLAAAASCSLASHGADNPVGSRGQRVEDPDEPVILGDFYSAHGDGRTPRPDLRDASIDAYRNLGLVRNALPLGLPFAHWTSMGPGGVVVKPADSYHQGSILSAGIVWDVAIDPRGSSDDVLYVATDGGIFKRTVVAGTASWSTTTDRLGVHYFGAVALEAGNPDVVYAGSGNLYHCWGDGIYRSADGGQTWSAHLGRDVFDGKCVTRVVAPAPNVVLVGLRQNDDQGGLYRSTDGGQTFTPIALPGLASQGPVSDLRLGTGADGEVFVAISGGGVFRSTDGGATFSNDLFAGAGAPSSYRYVVLAQGAPPNQNTMYAAVDGATNAFDAIYKTTDLGATWTRKAGQTDFAQGSYDLAIGVDPSNVDHLMLGITGAFVSTDGGDTLRAFSYGTLHSDFHAMTFSPAGHWTDQPAWYVGSDGGIAVSTNAGSSWSPLNQGLVNNVVMNLGIGRNSDANRAYTYAGMQDTGVQVHKPGLGGLTWFLGDGGDNYQVAVDPADPTRAYTSGPSLTTDGGNSWSHLSSWPLANQNYSIVQTHPTDPNFVYGVAGATLYQSSDRAQSFHVMNTFTQGDPTIAAIGQVANNPQLVWAATADNRIFLATGATGASPQWNLAPSSPNGPAGNAPTAIVGDPNNLARAVAVYAGYSANSPASTRHVWETIDFGSTWRDISGGNADTSLNVPDMPLFDVALDYTVNPSAVVVAGDLGVLRTDDGGGTWDVLGTGLPLIEVMKLAIDPSTSPALLRVATYGRGVFELATAARTGVAIVGHAQEADGSFASLCLTAGSNDDGVPTHLAPCQGADNQTWTLSPNGDIRIFGDKCLDARGPSSDDGTVAQIWTCVDQSQQKWHAMNNGNLVGYGNKCLDVDTQTPDGGKVQLWSCGGTRELAWANQSFDVQTP